MVFQNVCGKNVVEITLVYRGFHHIFHNLEDPAYYALYTLADGDDKTVQSKTAVSCGVSR